MEARFVLIILFLIFLSFGPDQQQLKRPVRDPVDLEWWSQHLLGVLRNSSYGELSAREDRWLNLTGFRSQDDYQWELLPDAQALSREQFRGFEGLDQRRLPVYRRPFGEVRGRFGKVRNGNSGHRTNMTALVPDNEYMMAEYQRNITDRDGEISVDLVGGVFNASSVVQEIKADVKIYGESSPGNGWDVNMAGIHFVDTGIVVLTTISDKFNAGFGLPQFMLNEKEFNESKPLINRMMAEALRRIKDGERPVRSGSLFPAPNCEFIIWLQQKPVQIGLSQNQTVKVIQEIEKELESPAGASIGQAPALEYSAVLFSPDCGFILEAHMTGPKAEIYWSLVRRLLFGLIILIGLEIILLKRQMEETSTPSRRSRIAYQTVAMMAMGDGLLFSGMIAILIADDNMWLLVAAAAFVNCLNVAFLEVKFLFDLWTVQVGQPAERERDRALQAVPVDTLPLPATAPRPVDTGSTPIILPPDQDIGAAAAEDQIAAQARLYPAQSFATFYSRFYFVMVILMFVSMWAMSWPRWLRSAYANTFGFIYLSFWVPQIYRNVIRNCRKALSWEYVIGISILRLTTVVYWYLDHRNLLSIDASPLAAYVLIGWVWLQIMVLASHDLLGPRLFVKDEWCPPAYDYHPILHEDEEAGLTIGIIASASEAKDKDDKDGNRKIFDCAICMNEIDVPVASKGEGKGATWLEQRNYMVTPCRHIFHSECLEGWMNLRLVCPICREGLPPL